MSTHKRAAAVAVGTNPASTVTPSVVVAGRTRAETLELAHKAHAHVAFSYRSTFDGSLVQVDGILSKITRGVGVVNLRVDRLWYAVPAGTLVTIETGELR